jgi:hypothetical protein
MSTEFGKSVEGGPIQIFAWMDSRYPNWHTWTKEEWQFQAEVWCNMCTYSSNAGQSRVTRPQEQSEMWNNRRKHCNSVFLHYEIQENQNAATCHRSSSVRKVLESGDSVTDGWDRLYRLDVIVCVVFCEIWGSHCFGSGITQHFRRYHLPIFQEELLRLSSLRFQHCKLRQGFFLKRRYVSARLDVVKLYERAYDIWYDIFNCNWVATRWQLFSTHIHTNNTRNVTKQTIHRTQKYIEQHKKYIEQHNN